VLTYIPLPFAVDLQGRGVDHGARRQAPQRRRDLQCLQSGRGKQPVAWALARQPHQREQRFDEAFRPRRPPVVHLQHQTCLRRFVAERIFLPAACRPLLRREPHLVDGAVKPAGGRPSVQQRLVVLVSVGDLVPRVQLSLSHGMLLHGRSLTEVSRPRGSFINKAKKRS
jgi:hypothetical protein